ncbi:PAS domain S-box protein [Oscillatoria sp. FACHB-1407]|uniref:hybrid sensor histidine kinase/response regulator n=1 Tax=Oscillatoria sp. FACHB-1407 TaxID=2692847 RepID=UPI001686AA2E|nr:PAS domain S-box protein [Oscillatoria sp. FACHB-1407]MBD2461278.1 PAS domain S-box protein [Oscillatoria sp. FACHB-1407]
MKRDATGKFIRNWADNKQRISLSLTSTAWRSLNKIAQRHSISRSEVIERLARNLASQDPFEQEAYQAQPTQQDITQPSEPPPMQLNTEQINAQVNLEPTFLNATNLNPVNTKQDSKPDVEQRIVAILESISDAFVAIDRNWCYAYVNHAATQILHKTPEQLLGKHIWNEVFPDHIDGMAYRNMHRAMTEQIAVSWEEYGEPIGRWLEVNAYPSPEGIAVYFRDITERKQADVEREQLLYELEVERSRFEAVLQQMPAGVMIADAVSGKLVLANEQAEQIVGYSRAQLLGLDAYHRFAPDDSSPPSEQKDHSTEMPLVRSLRTGEVITDEEMEWCHEDGHRIVMSANSAPILNQQGQIVAAVVVFQDITDRKQSELERRRLEAELRQSEERLQLALATVRMVVWDFDVKTNEVICSESAREIWGFQRGTAEEFIDHVHPGDRAHLIATNARALTGEIPYTVEYRVVQPNGVICWLRSEGKIYRNTAGQPDRIIGISVDVTQQKRIENERTHTEELLRRSANRARQLQRVTAALAEASTPKQVAKAIMERGITALGAKAGTIVLVSEESDPVVGKTASRRLKLSEIVGYPQPILDEWQEFPITAPIALAETVRTEKPIFLGSEREILKQFPQMASILAITGSRAIATIPLIVSGRTLGGMGISFADPQPFDEDDRTFILTLAQQCAQAIARAQLYEAEQRARATAEAANRAKDEFLAVLSHELRTPLNPILGWTQLLLRGKLDADTTAIALASIERNAKLQVQLIEDLLDISRILQGKLNLNSCPVNLAATVEAAMETIRLAAETKAIQVQTHFAFKDYIVLGDSGRLQQVIWNLLSNAVKFTPHKGKIDVYLERVGDYVSIQIQDTGKGIQPEFLPHVFDYFRQADSSITRTFGGLGLGLAIARHIVELHGGIIQAESLGEDQGATFTVTLPVWKGAPDPALMNSFPSSSHANLDGVRVLVVDDEADNLDLVTFILEQAGATVTAVASALEGLKHFQQDVPDILLADIGMPDVDGYNFLHQIRQLPLERGGQVPAIALTAYASKTDQLQALAAGFQQHIAKPITPDHLLTEIQHLVVRG